MTPALIKENTFNTKIVANILFANKHEAGRKKSIDLNRVKHDQNINNIRCVIVQKNYDVSIEILKC